MDAEEWRERLARHRPKRQHHLPSRRGLPLGQTVLPFGLSWRILVAHALRGLHRHSLLPEIQSGEHRMYQWLLSYRRVYRPCCARFRELTHPCPLTRQNHRQLSVRWPCWGQHRRPVAAAPNRDRVPTAPRFHSDKLKNRILELSLSEERYRLCNKLLINRLL